MPVNCLEYEIQNSEVLYNEQMAIKEPPKTPKKTLFGGKPAFRKLIMG
jgi:hypothetical protein